MEQGACHAGPAVKKEKMSQTTSRQEPWALTCSRTSFPGQASPPKVVPERTGVGRRGADDTHHGYNRGCPMGGPQAPTLERALAAGCLLRVLLLLEILQVGLDLGNINSRMTFSLHDQLTFSTNEGRVLGTSMEPCKVSTAQSEEGLNLRVFLDSCVFSNSLGSVKGKYLGSLKSRRKSQAGNCSG